MYSTLFTATLFSALALLARADFTVVTPAFTQCQPATLNWDSTTGPYDVILVSPNDPCGDAVVDLGYINTNSYQWPAVSLPAGTQVMISILDANDQEGWSGTVTVQPSNDNSCLSPSNNSPPNNSPGNNSPAPSSPTPHTPTTPSSTSSSTSPAATVVGAANNGLMGGAVSGIHFNGVAIVVTVLGAVAALL